MKVIMTRGENTFASRNIQFEAKTSTCHSRLKNVVMFLKTDKIGESVRGVIKFSLITRILLVFSMVISCTLLPNFDAGNDVQVFDMRLNLLRDSHGTMGDSSSCFCLEGHACEILFSSSKSKNGHGIIGGGNVDTNTRRRQRNDIIRNPKCMGGQKRKVAFRTVYIYDILLSPFTRWDAARFLTIAVDPRARYPRLNDGMQNPECLIKNIGDIDSKDTCHVVHGDDDDYRFTSSEQAHAFFPLFPLLLRYLSLLLATLIPQYFLPPTYEALVVLSGVLWNVIAFTMSAVAFHNLTRSMLIHATKWREEAMDDVELKRDVVRISNLATVLYCLNPANIFFVTCYSESTFSLFTFVGYYLFEKCQTCATRKGIFIRLGYLWCSTMSWMLASYTRSNGTLISAFIFLHLCGNILNHHWRNTICFKNCFLLIIKSCGTICVYSVSIFAVIAPLLLHDQRGIEMHCKNRYLQHKPHWCAFDADDPHSKFSLYRYVQKAHWNIGFLNYWELKQIPNFLLAFPILFSSFNGVMYWIQKSWNEGFADNLHGTARVSIGNILKWSFQALKKMEATERSPVLNKEQVPLYLMLAGSRTLAHYALLAGFACLGTFIAHVQISTRMICSACPAIYWFMTLILLRCEDHVHVGSKVATDKVLVCYLLSFHVLSVVFHVNWLPWT